jgi:hypothetical protein
MSDLETRLTAALNADTPPARDALFRVAVLVRRERARFRRRVALAVAVAAALAAVSAPALDAWLAADVERFWIVALGAVAALFVLPALLPGAPAGVGSVVRILGRRLFP